MQDTQHEAWQVAVDDARKTAQEQQGVEFTYPDTEPFRQAQLPIHDEILQANPSLRPIYEQIQEINAKFAEEGGQNE